MKNIFNFHRAVAGGLATLLVTGLLMAPSAKAAVSDEDFNALKEAVRQLSEQVQSLKQTNALVQQQHEKDQQTIKDMQSKLTETQATAQDAAQKSTAAATAAANAIPGGLFPDTTLRPPLYESSVKQGFSMVGDAEIQYVNANHQNGSFELADFAPIFLYRGGDRILFEAGFDFTVQNNATNGPGYSTEVNLSFAQLDYVMNDYMTFCGGLILLPLGTYSERTAGWLNEFPDDPLAIDLIPGNGVGAQLRGGVAVGTGGALLNYAIYGVNGPASADGTGKAGSLDVGGNVGVWNDGTSQNLHRDPVGGGRIGYFMPFKPHYDVEVGVSGQSGQWYPGEIYSAGVVDGAIHLGPNFETKGEYIAARYGTTDRGNITAHGYWVQSGYKLAGLNLNLPLLNDTELVGRYDSYHDGVSTSTQRYTVGYIYFLSNTLLFEGDYEFLNSNDPTQPTTQLILQVSYGF